jgi:hypothetical protein
MKKKGLIILAILAGVIPLTISLGISHRADPFSTPEIKPLETQYTENENETLAGAILDAVSNRQKTVLGFLVNDVVVDNFRYSEDGSWGAAWLGYRDPQSGEPLPSEPGLALARKDGKEWQVIMPSDKDWSEALTEAPESLIPLGERDSWLLFSESALAAMPQQALTGYLLPWAAGERRYLSQSVGHDKYTPSGTAHFSFDFYLSGKMWNLYASKGGTVWRVKYDIPTCTMYNCGQTLGNYIVLRDDTTSPVSYQLYLHLAYDSIPPSLRVIGTPVRQGQFIGVADNTGQSWGHHLHFQVHTNPDSYWGTSVDITFADVAINGGRPRVSPYDPPYCLSTDVCQTYQSSYVSSNIIIGDTEPPSGEIISPVTGATITSPSLYLAGFASDRESGLYSAQFLAYYNGIWNDVGPLALTSPFVYEWDMCAANVPDGPVSFAMRLRDNDGNLNHLAGIRHIIKQYTCPPPAACEPASNQVALYKRADYQDCVLFGAGSYPTGVSLGLLGNNAAHAIKPGSDIHVTLFMDENYRTRGETFAGSDAGLSDNLIGTGTVSSMKIVSSTEKPFAPIVVPDHNITSLPAGDSLTLVWENGGGALEYQVQLTPSGGTPVDLGWQPEPYIHLTGLAADQYSWKVRARNNDLVGPYSSIFSFEVAPIQTYSLNSLLNIAAPYTDDMEGLVTQWAKTGLWTLKNDSILAHSGSKSWWFQGSGGDYDRNNLRSFGTLTSPPIEIPAPGFYLRFWYRNETEGSRRHWDQRWVQVSADGGSFENLLQLTDDPQAFWLQSPYINLSEYAGRTIRVRFRFDTIDAALNGFKGWAIDDVRITAETPPVCSPEQQSIHSFGQAVSIAYGATLQAEICPSGDMDLYSFSASAGDRIVVDIGAQASGSELDPILYLLDSDQVSFLAEQDDRVPVEQLDPLMNYTLSRSGDYYLKVKAWDHPGQGGPEYFYTLHLLQDREPPRAGITYPQTGRLLPITPFYITATVGDSVSGVNRVEFFYHSGNWLDSKWTLLGVDTDGQDGWNILFDPRDLNYASGIAFHIQAFDMAGNMAAAGVWNLFYGLEGQNIFLPFIHRDK